MASLSKLSVRVNKPARAPACFWEQALLYIEEALLYVEIGLLYIDLNYLQSLQADEFDFILQRLDC